MKSRFLSLVFFVMGLFSFSIARAGDLALTELPQNSPSFETVNLSNQVLPVDPVSGQLPSDGIMVPFVNPAKIEINIPARRLKLYNNNELVYEFPVAVGAPAHKTPVSERALTQIVWNPWWLPPDSPWAKDAKPTPPGPNNPLGPVKMNLGAAILLHGTNKPQSVGRPASHGCMRMNNEDAKILAWWVQSHFTDKTDPSLYDETYPKKRSQSFYVNLTTPIPVEIKYNLFEKKGDQILVHPDVYGRIANKKAALKEWLVLQGTDANNINEQQISDILSQVKKETMPVLFSSLLNQNILQPTSVTPNEELGVAAKIPFAN
ncbi:MAG: hypothetical protein ACD_73C00285G0002 [uncultured bacterium]|nr:MAG: hypothetical protein ACD_73C00285G0002 [uncultured bacterium]